MRGKNGRFRGHDQKCTPGKFLNVAAETKNEARDKINDARGNRVVHVLQVDDHRNFLAKVLTNGGGILKVSRTHYRDLKRVIHSKLATRGFIVVINLTDVLGHVTVVVD